MLRMAGAGLFALALHVGAGLGARAVAKRVEHTRPIRLQRFLLQKDMMREILERIQELRDQQEALDVVAFEEQIEELEELIEEIPEDDAMTGEVDEADEVELDVAYDDSAYTHEHTEGEMGNPDAQESDNRYGVAGPEDNPDPHIARQAALRDAAEFGMIGLLNAGAGGDPDAPTAPWGRDDSLGTDPLSARGNMWGDSIGESFGGRGLGMSGIGKGGGGRGEGIGLGSVGTIGHGAGTGTGQGFGSGHGRLGRSHRARPAGGEGGGGKATKKANNRKVRASVKSVSASGLDKAHVKRKLKSKRSAFRACYAQARASDPSLSGNVRLRLNIDSAGRVVIGNRSDAVISTISEELANCMLSQASRVVFEAPTGGAGTVSFRIALSVKKS